uniref:BAALC binder of MAP3K1 and KLF4 n=1 Tax=Panthera tigris altaica TaxID=74533 RepID=A0A8C9KF64_PANTA
HTGWKHHTAFNGCSYQLSRVILCFSPQGVLEDGLSSNGVPRSTAPGGISNPEKRMSCGTQCPNPQSLTSGPLTQKQNGLRTTEAKRDAKRMSAKEVTINVTDSIRQADRSRRITKNCVN